MSASPVKKVEAITDVNFVAKRGNPVKHLFFGWVEGLIRLGAKRQLNQSDLPPMELQDSTVKCSEEFDVYWQRELKKPQPKYWRAIVAQSRNAFILSMFLTVVYQALQLVGPMLIPSITKWVDDPTQPFYLGFVYLFVLGFAAIFSTSAWAHSVFIMVHNGIKMRTTLISSIYSKTLRLGTSGTDSLDTGNILNLMSNDTQRMVDTFQWINQGIVAPIIVIVVSALLINVIGAYALIGIGIMIVLFPLNGFVASKFIKYRRLILKLADRRIKLENEMLGGMRAVKFYAWETSMQKGE